MKENKEKLKSGKRVGGKSKDKIKIAHDFHLLPKNFMAHVKKAVTKNS